MNEIKKLIANGHLGDALEKALDVISVPIYIVNRLIKLKNNFSEQERQILRGTITHEMYHVFRNRTIEQFLELLDDWEKNQNTTFIIDEKSQTQEGENYNQIAETVCLAEGLCKSYPNNSSFYLNGVDLRLKLGEITAIVGRNAAGKTTLLKIVAGILAKSKGEIAYPLLHKKDKLNWYKVKQQIAYIPQMLTKWDGTVQENLHFITALKGIKGIQNDLEVRKIISRLELDEYTDSTWNELSGGFKMRFELAKALIWKPSLVILDEPLAHLDIKAQEKFLIDLQNMCRRNDRPCAVLISSQHVFEIEAVSDYLIFFDGGKIKFNGRRDDLRPTSKYRTYELQFDVKDEEEDSKQLRKRLNELLLGNAIEIRQDRGLFLLYTNLLFGPDQLLHLLCTMPYALKYFREITFSSKQFFHE